MTPSREVRGEALDYDAPPARPHTVTVPVEAPVNVVYATLPHAVMMATPADLEDFALGFSVTEGVVTDPGEIRGITVSTVPRGIVVDIGLMPAALRRHMARRRSMAQDMNLEHCVPLRLFGVHEHSVAHDSGVVHHHIQPTKMVNGQIDHLFR